MTTLREREHARPAPMRPRTNMVFSDRSPAAGTIAAVQIDRNVGMFRWQLRDYAIPISAALAGVRCRLLTIRTCCDVRSGGRLVPERPAFYLLVASNYRALCD
jgi:hypothetical protein